MLEIQEAIVNLTSTERIELLRWLTSYEEDEWDRQMTRDAATGKLDFMKEQAEKGRDNGKLSPLPGEV